MIIIELINNLFNYIKQEMWRDLKHKGDLDEAFLEDGLSSDEEIQNNDVLKQQDLDGFADEVSKDWGGIKVQHDLPDFIFQEILGKKDAHADDHCDHS